MNIYSQIRDYVKSMVREVNPKIKEHNQPHTPENIGAFKYDDSYYLRFLPVASIISSGYVTLQIPVEIEVGKKSGSKPNESHDEILCDATNIFMRLIQKTNYSATFNDIQPGSISPEPIATNEQWTKVTLSVTINLIYEVR
jgi:hypothetical protein